MANRLFTTLKVIWASPNSALGLGLGIVSLGFGTRVQRRDGCIEFYGGLIKRLLRSIPLGASCPAAMTLGHTIIGQTAADLDRCRAHEQVHVRQYERWGPFFLPAYLGWSCWLWVLRKDPYRENPFEVEAYALEDPASQATD